MKLKLTKEEKKAAKQARKEKGMTVLAEFKKFIMRGNVIDMAVGVIVATAFTKIVSSLTNGIFMPFITFLVGDIKFSELKTILRPAQMEGEEIIQAEIALNWGTVIENVISFFLIALIIFVIIKTINSIRGKIQYAKEKLQKKEEEENPTPPAPPAPKVPTTNELLEEIIVLLKNKDKTSVEE